MPLFVDRWVTGMEEAHNFITAAELWRLAVHLPFLTSHPIHLGKRAASEILRTYSV